MTEYVYNQTTGAISIRHRGIDVPVADFTEAQLTAQRLILEEFQAECQTQIDREVYRGIVHSSRSTRSANKRGLHINLNTA